MGTSGVSHHPREFELRGFSRGDEAVEHKSQCQVDDNSDYAEDLVLSEEVLTANLKLPGDLEIRARLLADRALPSLQKEARRIIERLSKRPQPLELSAKYLLAELNIELGDWGKGSQLMAEVAAAAKKTDIARFPIYVDRYINALLDHYEASEAQPWLETLKPAEPKAFGPALLEARTLVPKTRPGSKVAAPARVADVLAVLQKAIADDQIKSVIGDKVTPSEQKTAKIGVVIRTLESLLYEVTIHGSTTDQDLLRSAIEEYYSQIIDGPADQLVRVRYLVHQGKRRIGP